MKRLIIFACLIALALPVAAQQQPKYISPPIAPELPVAPGLVVAGVGSASIRYDQCSLILTFYTKSPPNSTAEPLGQKAAATQLDIITKALATWNLKPIGQPKVIGYNSERVGFTTWNTTLPLQVGPKGEILFGMGTMAEIRKTLEILDVVSSFSFSCSPTAQVAMQPQAIKSAVKNGIAQAKWLASAAGLSAVNLVGMREMGGVVPQSEILAWPTVDTLIAPERSMSYTIHLFFSPLSRIIETKN
jgi:hypothetical protein